MAPDLDSLIRSNTDPLLYLEYHRQFTHALVFIPIGGLICALALHQIVWRRLSFGRTYLYCTLGYATHGLLDACTTYGTQLLWPFSNARVAWHTISIIDPLFTVPIIILVVVGAFAARRWIGRAALAWGVLYLAFGAVQRQRAEAVGAELAASRGHAPVRLEAKPSFANLLVWKIVYQTATDYHVDAVRAGLETVSFPGAMIPKLDVRRDLPWLDPDSQQAHDVERFRWFSNDYLALDPQRRNFVIDIRYSLVPNDVEALWGIQLDPSATADAHVRFIWDRDLTDDQKRRFMNMLRGF